MPSVYEKQIVALGRVLQTLREEENADVLIETTLNYLQAEFEYTLIWIGLYDRLDHRLFGKGGVTPNGDATLLKAKFFLNPGDLLEQVVIQQRPVAIPDLREEMRAGEWRRVAQQLGIQGTLIFPLRCKDRCFGVVLLGSHFWGASPSAASKAQLSLLFGGLAMALYQIEVDWQRSSTKRPDQALFQVVERLSTQATMQQRLEAVVTTTQQFISPTRTSLYWFEPQGRYFWHRVGNQQKARVLSKQQAGSSGLLVQDVNDFYLALAAGQTVAIGAGRSPLKADVTELLMKRLRARSVLAAPIIVRQELVGFLTVEGNEPRIWEEVEKNYVRAAAGLLVIVAEGEKATGVNEQSLHDQELVSRIASIVANNSNNDSTTALKECATVLLERLGVERFLLLRQDVSGEYHLVYQHQVSSNRRSISTPLPAIVDFGEGEQQGERGRGGEGEKSSTPKLVVIEDWEEDDRLVEWKAILMMAGVRSLLVCSLTSSENSSLLVLGHGSPRTWNRTEQDLAVAIAQQLSLLFSFTELQTLAIFNSEIAQKLTSALNALIFFPEDSEAFEKAFVTFLSNELSCPLVALLGWTPDNPLVRVTGSVAAPSFALPLNLAVNPHQDVLIQETLNANGFIERRTRDLPLATRSWLSSTETGSLLVMALPDFGLLETGSKGKGGEEEQGKQGKQGERGRSSINSIPNSQSPVSRPKAGTIVLLADRAQRQWPSHLLPVLETLARQFAMSRHYLRSWEAMKHKVRDLEQLNWYKHRCLQAFHQTVAINIKALTELHSDEPQQDINPKSNVTLTSSGNVGNQSSKSVDSLRRMRQGQLLNQLENNLVILSPLLNAELWQSTLTLTEIPLANLLKRCLLLLTPLVKQRHTSVKIHVPSSDRIRGDRLKLECIFFELLLSSVNYTQPEGVVDVWYRQRSAQSMESEGMNDELEEGNNDSSTQKSTINNQHFSSVELFISDKVAFERMKAQGGNMNEDPIFTSIEPPNLNLSICQQVLKSWGGDLQFYNLQNGQLIIKVKS